MLRCKVRFGLTQYQQAASSRFIGSSFHVRRAMCPAVTLPTATAASAPMMSVPRRPFSISSLFSKNEGPKVYVNETRYDSTTSHYQGSFLGVSTDVLMYYAKVIGLTIPVILTIYLFFKGYVWLAEFSLVTVGKLGFTAGFVSCAILYSVVLGIVRRYRIAPNAVYNQSIELVLQNPEVRKFLGSSPKTGDFRAYCATGGFKLPLVRRIRSGSYELSDLLGSKPRRLQMMLLLKNTETNKEGLVSADVRTTSRGMRSTHYFHSLAVHLTDPTGGVDGKPKTTSVMIIGKEEDAVYKGFMRF